MLAGEKCSWQKGCKPLRWSIAMVEGSLAKSCELISLLDVLWRGVFLWIRSFTVRNRSKL